MYGYWTLSDIYEEMNTGSALRVPRGELRPAAEGRSEHPRVVRPGQAGVQRVPPAAHDDRQGRAGDGRHRRATDNGVGAVATLAADGNSIQILVYNHVNSFDIVTWQAMASESTLVS